MLLEGLGGRSGEIFVALGEELAGVELYASSITLPSGELETGTSLRVAKIRVSFATLSFWFSAPEVSARLPVRGASNTFVVEGDKSIELVRATTRLDAALVVESG